MMLIDGTPVRNKARKEYQKVLRDLDKARAEHEQFNAQDRPRYERWLNHTFGALLTEARELLSKCHELELLVQEVHQEFYLGDHESIASAYRAVLHRREHPPEEAQQGDFFGEEPSGEAQAEGNPESNEDDDFFKEIYERGRQFQEEEYARLQDLRHPPDSPPPAARLKELYRTLVRKLHPDKAVDFDEKKREWWHEVQSAYERGDAEQLEVILTLCEIDEKGLSNNTSVSILSRITHRFKSTLRALRRELKQYKDHPAWNFSQRIHVNGFEHEIRERLETQRSDLRFNLTRLENTVSYWETLSRSRPSRRPRGRRSTRKSVYQDDDFF
jgi:hypothetical protein